MAEIAISATLDVDDATGMANMATIRAVRSLLDIDLGYGSFGNAVQRAVFSTIDVDNSLFGGNVAKLEAMRSTFDVDAATTFANLNVGYQVRSLIDADATTAIGRINKIANVYPEWEVEESTAAIALNSSKSLKSEFNCDRAVAKLNYLYLKNPPLPPEIDGGIRIRSAKNLVLNKSQLVAGSTYNLEATVDGQRIDGVNLVFSVKSAPLGDFILLQKATINTPSEYLVNTIGIGDILISNSTPITSGRLGIAEEITATIVIKPDEFKVARNTVFAYEFWAYDALGTNTLLEAGTFSVGVT